MHLATDRGIEPHDLDLQTLFAPRGIAVIGASPDKGRHNGRPVVNLLRTGYTGRIYPVNPRHREMGGMRCYASIGDIDGPVDIAYVMVRAELVERVLVDCAEGGVRTVVVCSSGFAEEGGTGVARQQDLRDLARSLGIRLIGPNCIGVISVPERAASCTTLNVTTTLTPGDVAVVSQSGGMAANLFNRLQGEAIGVRVMVSLGNEADVDLADMLFALADDPDTRTVLLFVEQLRDPARFRRAVTRACESGKQVLALKVGRSEAGVRSARSHTGAMAGSYAVFRDVLTAMGVLVVDSMNDLVDVARSLQSVALPRGRRLLVISPSGGECGYVADRAVAEGLELPELSPDLVCELAEIMRFGTPGNPLDLTGQVIGDEALLDRVFAAVAKSAEFDLQLIALPTWGEFDSRRLLPPILRATRSSAVPMAITAWQARNLTEYRDEALTASGCLTFDDADRAVRALSLLDGLRGDRNSADAPLRVAEGIVAVPPTALEDESGALTFLADHDVPVAEHRAVTSENEASAAAEALGWPVVVKGLVAGLEHKSESGLVRVGIVDAAGVGAAVDAIRAAADRKALPLGGFLVARQYRGVEAIVGAVQDREFGPVVMLGAGGTAAELVDDKAFLACPASGRDVERALTGLRLGRLLKGHRGADYDVAALVALVVAFSRLVLRLPDVGQVDLNPVIVSAEEDGGGARAVDALLRH